MNRARAVVRGVGELFVTAGFVLLLFCGYQLFWTNVEADRAQNQVGRELARTWRAPEPNPSTGPSPGPTPEPVLTKADLGKGIAFLRIPRLGTSFTVPVVEGVRTSDLARGVGHYPKTAVAGAVGNFAVAGHRATHGEPFRNLDRMRTGDSVVVETRTTWFTYIVDKTQIVQPDDVWVIDPVPGKPTSTSPTRRLLTLTTCNPRWASTQRLIIFSHLQDTRPKTEGTPPALLAKGR